ncbi:MAG: ATP-binding protein [Chloroflexota bacterium]|nr:ATP-binding protein [Chloroflexota bacterium]
MDRLENPYRPGAGTAPPALLGRDELVDAFAVTMRRALGHRPGKSYMPIGLRGVGKTVLLNRFAEIAEQEGSDVVFIEAPETGDFRLLLAVRLRKILLTLNAEGPARRVINKALGVLQSFMYHLPDGSSISIGVDAIVGSADSGLLSEDLTDVLVATGEAAAAAGTGLLLAIDEVQYLETDELAALITAIHRTTQLDLPIVLVGAGLPQLPGLAGEAKSYAERLFDFPLIGSLGQTDATDAILIPAAELGVAFEPDAVELIVAESRGYPYFLQEWGFHVWNLSGSSPINIDDVRAARSSVIDQLDRNFFLVRLDRLTPKEKDYLRAMAELGPGPHRSGDIAAKLGVRVESVAPRRSGLIVKGMIYSPAHGDTAFTVPLFDEFLKRTLTRD